MTISVTPTKLVRVIEIALLVAIFVLLLWSKPWDSSSSSSDARKITVNGQATVTATPDEFTFTPYFQETGSDKDSLRDGLVKKANTIVDRLKELGVAEEKINLDASAYDRWYWNDGEEGVLSVSIKVQATGDDLVQSIQDYLLTTGAEGQLTPQASFSEAKQKELDALAVEQASADAKAKAEAQAGQFDAKLGRVISVEQSSESLFGYPEIYASDQASSEISVRESSLPVLPGENEYRQSVTVTYELK